MNRNVRKRTFLHVRTTKTAHAQADQSFRCPHEETLHPWLSETRPVKTLIESINAQVDRKLRRTHMSEGTISNVAANITRTKRKNKKTNKRARIFTM